MAMKSDFDEQIDRMIEAGEVPQATALIVRLSEARDPSACRWRGIMLLGGEYFSRDVVAARHWLGFAADAGDADALWLEAALNANGSGRGPDWQAAVSRLAILAQTDADAAAQLDHIRTLALDAEGYPVAPIEPTSLCAEPSIRWFGAFCDEYECRQIVISAADILSPSMIVDPVSGRTRPDPVRTSLAATIGPTRESIVIAAVLRRIAAVSGTPLTHGESLSLLRYADGQQYRPHHDAIAGATNQRTTTAILYLNDGFLGGQTIFPALDIRVEPRAGGLLVFDNLDADGAIDQRAQHCGLPVVRGAKWITTRWIRAGRYDPWAYSPADQTR